MKIRKFLLIALLLLMAANLNVLAQPVQEVGMADQMRSEGKIYVVVTVVLIVFAGLIVYLLNLDRKISKIEKEKQGL